MNLSNDFSGRVMGLDTRVWLSMLAGCVLSLLLLGFKRLGTRNCMPLSITVDGKVEEGVAVRNPNQLLNFAIKDLAAGTVTWRFGDGGTEVGSRVSHRFTEKGDYTVVATLPGGCSYEQYVTIQRPLYHNAKEQELMEVYMEPRNPKAGSSVRFWGLTNMGARSYEWKLMDGTDSSQYGQVATFSFPYPGIYKVRMMLDHNPARVLYKEVNIAAEALPEAAAIPGLQGGAGGADFGLPGGGSPSAGGIGLPPAGGGPSGGTPLAESAPAPQNETSQVLAIEPDTFMAMLQEVIDGTKELGELYRYLGYKETTKVQVNDKPVVKIGAFCKQMADNKDHKMESIEFQKDENKWIMTIKVKVKEENRGFFKRLFGRG